MCAGSCTKYYCSAKLCLPLEKAQLNEFFAMSPVFFDENQAER